MKNISLNKLFTDKVQNMNAYQAPNGNGMIKLDMMEMPYKLPADLQKALVANLEYVSINRYPSTTSTSLIAKIRSCYAIDEKLSIMLGNGSDELIQIILMALNRPKAVVMSPEPSFSMYRQTAELLGMNFIGVDLNDNFTINRQLFLEQVKLHKPAIIFIAYPNNPTGNLFNEEFLVELLQTTNGFVVFDEAYGDYADKNTMDLLLHYENALLIRTFSKIGLAGIRLGYMLGNKANIAEFNKVRMPFNTNVLTQAAARFMLEQSTFFEQNVRQIKAEKQIMYDWLNTNDRVQVFSSQTNFLLVRLADANEVYTQLRDNYQILVKNLHGSHALMANILRITIGSDVENEKLRQALIKILN